MPRITAPTVAEHRAIQERALLDAAHALLEETGDAPTMAEVAKRAGLARSSVYQYFASRHDLLQAMVRDIFPRWTERITSAMQRAQTPADRILAYAIENVALVHEGSHAVGSALMALAPGEALDEQANRMHVQIQEPLIETLQELGVAAPESMAEMINSVVHAATRLLDTGQSFEEVKAHLYAMLGPLVSAHGGTGSAEEIG